MISHGVGPILGALRGAPITPAQIVADTNNYAPTGLSATGLVRLDTDALRTITGLSATGVVDGQAIAIANVGAFPIRLADESASSTAANRFTCPGDRGYVIPADDGVRLIYDTTSTRWRLTARQRASTTFVMYAAGTATWTNMPAAATEWFGVTTRRCEGDLLSADQFRLTLEISVAGAAGALIAPQYSVNAGATWLYLDGTADGAVGAAGGQVVLTSTGRITSAWATLDGPSRAVAILRLKGSGGDGVADPGFFRGTIEVR